MIQRGRPLNSGYRSQILIVWSLITKHQLCFDELVRDTGIHRNRVAPNANILIRKGLVEKRRERHRMIYRLKDKSKANDFIFSEFMKYAGREAQKQEPETLKNMMSLSGWRSLKEGSDWVIDKEMGIVTLAAPPKRPIEVTYRAGYPKTPNAIKQATALLVAGILKWIVAIKENKSEDIHSIPKRIWKQIKMLIRLLKKETQEKERVELLRRLDQYVREVRRLEESQGLVLFKDYQSLLKWAKELKLVEHLKATKHITKGALEPRVGPRLDGKPEKRHKTKKIRTSTF